MTKWYESAEEPPVDYVAEGPPPKRMSRLATATLFILTFIIGMFAGLAL